jgi:hypothetical protein
VFPTAAIYALVVLLLFIANGKPGHCACFPAKRQNNESFKVKNVKFKFNLKVDFFDFLLLHF